MTSRQIKDLIRNQAKKNNIDAQILLRNYMLERLLERISLSKYKWNFILNVNGIIKVPTFGGEKSPLLLLCR